MTQGTVHDTCVHHFPQRSLCFSACIHIGKRFSTCGQDSDVDVTSFNGQLTCFLGGRMLLEKEVMVTAKMSTTWRFNQPSFVSAKCSPCSLYLCLLCPSGSSQEFRKAGYFSLCVISTGWWQFFFFSYIWFGTWTDRAAGMNAEKGKLALLGLTLEARWSSLGGDCIASLPNPKGRGSTLGAPHYCVRSKMHPIPEHEDKELRFRRG